MLRLTSNSRMVGVASLANWSRMLRKILQIAVLHLACSRQLISKPEDSAYRVLGETPER